MATGQKPTIVQKKSPNQWVGRSGQIITAICNHIMDGSMSSTDSWFSSQVSNASAHFGVAKKGDIWQWVDTANTAWANGIVRTPDLSLPWLAKAITKKINPNRLTISIEHEGYTGEVMPESQYQATLALHKWLISEFNIPVSRTHIIGHYQIDKEQRANCPGKTFPWQRLLQDLETFFKPGFSQHFPETGYSVNNTQKFLDYWRAKGGLELFGYPISGVSADKDGKLVQWFERARFEYDATNKAVQLGLVGREAYDSRK